MARNAAIISCHSDLSSLPEIATTLPLIIPERSALLAVISGLITDRVMPEMVVILEVPSVNFKEPT